MNSSSTSEMSSRSSTSITSEASTIEVITLPAPETLPTRSKEKAEWETYAPINANTLYARVINCTEDIQDICKFIADSYAEKPNDTILYLMNFFIALAGFQQNEIRQIRMDVIGDQKIIYYLQDHTPQALHDGIYLFKSVRCAKLVDQSKRFVHELICSMYRESVLDKKFVTKVVAMLATMCDSVIRSLLHVGLTLLMEIMVALYKIIAHDQNEAIKYEPLMIIIDRQYLDKCCIEDEEMGAFKSQCCKHFTDWIFENPTKYLKNTYMCKLIALINDPISEVRIAAIEACIRIVQNFPENEWKSFRLTQSVEQRLKDVDKKVSCIAIAYMTLLVQEHPNDISVSTKKYIIERIYSKSYIQAFAAAKFFMEQIDDASNDNKILNIMILDNQYPTLTPLLVEALLDVYDPIHEYSALFEYLLLSEMDLNAKVQLLHIICESVTQLVTGTCELVRKHARKSRITTEKSTSITRTVLSHFEALFECFTSSYKAMIYIIKMMRCLNYKAADIQHLIEKIHHFQFVYDNCFANSLLREISLFFKLMFEYPATELPVIRRYWDQIINEATSTYNANIKQLTDLDICDDATNIECDLKQLYNYIENIFMEDLAFKNIFEILQTPDAKVTPKMTKYMIKICAAFIVQIINVEDEDLSETDIQFWKRQLNQFVTICFNYITAEGQQKKIAPAAFTSLFKILMRFRSSQDNPIVQDIYLPIADQENDLINFVESNIFANDEDSSWPVLKRKKLLHSYITLCITKVWHINRLAYIVRHLNTSYEEFGEIIKSALVSIDLKTKSPEYVNLIIYHTISLEYQEITKLSQPMYRKKQLQLERELKDLSKILSEVIKQHDFETIARRSIDYVIQSSDRLFFKFTAPFMKSLQPRIKQDLFSKLKSKFGAEEIRTDMYLSLAKQHLQTEEEIVKGRKGRKPKKLIFEESAGDGMNYSIDSSD